MKQKSLLTQTGFTFIEVLLYMVLMTIFLGVLTNIFVSTLDQKKETEATSAVEQDGRFILSRFIYDFNRADAVITPLTLGEITNNLVLTSTGITLQYLLNVDNLTLGSDNLNSSESKISGLTFKKLGNIGGKPTVQITFTVTSQTDRSKGPEIRNYQTTLGIR